MFRTFSQPFQIACHPSSITLSDKGDCMQFINEKGDIAFECKLAQALYRNPNMHSFPVALVSLNLSTPELSCASLSIDFVTTEDSAFPRLRHAALGLIADQTLTGAINSVFRSILRSMQARHSSRLAHLVKSTLKRQAFSPKSTAVPVLAETLEPRRAVVESQEKKLTLSGFSSIMDAKAFESHVNLEKLTIRLGVGKNKERFDSFTSVFLPAITSLRYLKILSLPKEILFFLSANKDSNSTPLPQKYSFPSVRTLKFHSQEKWKSIAYHYWFQPSVFDPSFFMRDILPMFPNLENLLIGPIPYTDGLTGINSLGSPQPMIRKLVLFYEPGHSANMDQFLLPILTCESIKSFLLYATIGCWQRILWLLSLNTGFEWVGVVTETRQTNADVLPSDKQLMELAHRWGNRNWMSMCFVVRTIPQGTLSLAVVTRGMTKEKFTLRRFWDVSISFVSRGFPELNREFWNDLGGEVCDVDSLYRDAI